MIFNLFKAKPTLKELIPDGFVDIHSHILPGIDDGAKNIEESLELISKMKEMGFSKIIATPHTYQGLYNNSSSSIKNSYNKIKDKVDKKIEIQYASEYMIDETLIEKAHKKKLLCLEKNYVLVEMSFFSAPINLYEIIFKLRVNDYIPVLAHPERYRFIFDDFNKFHKLKKVGCEFQLNLLSLTGYYGKDVAIISDKLLKNNMIDYCGSDIHNINHVQQIYNKVIIDNFEMINEITNRNNLFK